MNKPQFLIGVNEIRVKIYTTPEGNNNCRYYIVTTKLSTEELKKEIEKIADGNLQLSFNQIMEVLVERNGAEIVDYNSLFNDTLRNISVDVSDPPPERDWQ